MKLFQNIFMENFIIHNGNVNETDSSNLFFMEFYII